MNDINFFDLNSMIIGIFAFGIFILILYKKIEFSRYIPGLICLIFVFIAEVFEESIYNAFFEFLENVGVLLGSVLLFLAAILEYYKSETKKK